MRGLIDPFKQYIHRRNWHNWLSAYSIAEVCMPSLLVLLSTCMEIWQFMQWVRNDYHGVANFICGLLCSRSQVTSRNDLPATVTRKRLGLLRIIG